MLPELASIPRRIVHSWRQRGNGPFNVRYLKGPRRDTIVEGAIAEAQSARARRLTETAMADMRDLMTRLGDQPTDPDPLPSSSYDTEAAAVEGCSTPPLGGSLLYGVVRAVRPRTVVEIGTAHGYGAYYIASALADNGDGRLCTLEGMWVRVRLARETVGRLGVAERVTVVCGDFRRTVPSALEGGDVDLVFSDGDKSVELTRAQFEQALEAMPQSGFLLFDDMSINREIRALLGEFVAHPRVGRAASFYGRWLLLQLSPPVDPADRR